MKKHTLLRNTWRSGLRAKGRFLSLFGIIALSTGFFAGLKMTGQDLKDSAEQYYRETHLMDLHLLSNVGFSSGDLDALAADGEIAQVYGAITETAFLPVGDDAADEIVKVCSLPTDMRKAGAAINQPSLTEGRMPQQADECLIEVNTPSVFQVGDVLTVVPADAESTALAVTEYKIVGRADWSMYVDFERGTAQIGNGSIDSFLLVMPEAFDCAYYTDVYLTLTKTADVNSFSERYLTLAEDEADAILGRTADFSASRAAELRDDAEAELADVREEIDSGWADYHDGEAELAEQLADAQQTLGEAAEKIETGKAELQSQKENYDKAKASYQQSADTVAQRERTVLAAEQDLNNAAQEVEAREKALDLTVNMCNAYQYTSVGKPYPADITQLIADCAAYDSADFSLSQALDQYFCMDVREPERENLRGAIALYAERCKVSLEEQLAGLEQSRQQLRISRQTLNAAKQELSGAKANLEAADRKITEAEAELQQAEADYQAGVDALAEKETEGREKLADAKAELDAAEAEYADAAAKLDDIAAEIEWYAFTRTENPGWKSFGEDADRVDRIASVFPVFFILVAALVCLTTMTRMVEEQRTEIGTCKALGYSAGAVSVQFLLYAAGASVLGTAVGTVIGYQAFPRAIFACYGMMYHYPGVQCPYHVGMALICLAAALLCTGLTALAACSASLREVPAMLMRPKPPKKGKRILLERWKWLWSKCSFHVKVTIRNFLRYRSRVLMTVLGICGCTALLVTGFGLYHSISAIVDLHFGEIFRYDVFGLYDGDENRALLDDALMHTGSITEYQFGSLRTGTARANHKSYEVNLLVTEDAAAFGDFVVLRDRSSHEAFTLTDDSVIINEKLGRLLEISAGDSITLADGQHAVRVAACSENYAFNYVFMTAECCRSLFGSYDANCFFANESAGTDEDALAEHLLATDALMRLQMTSQSGGNFRELVKALRYVVILVIVCSGLLAFAVLYNLANINILERMRELATIKVLGFYDNEVSAYIFRENVLSAFCGMLCGLGAGVFLCRFVVRTAEVDVVMFAPDIPWYCFVLAAAATMLFTFLVNLMLRRKLRQIDMAGSMKAFE